MMRDQAEKAVRKYFPYCPFCGEEDLDFQYAFRDALKCPSCLAQWHIYFKFFPELKKAVLEVAANDGRGTELLGKKVENATWRKLARESHRHMQETTPPPRPPMVKEKETIKETIIKEIVMISCQYCGGLMPQTSIFCPNCGARRKA